MSMHDEFAKPPSDFEPPRKSNPWPALLIGCGVVLLICVVACGGLTWWAYSNAKRLATEFGSDIARSAVVSVVDSSDLSPEDKKAVNGQVDRVVDAYKEGRIDLEDVTGIMQELAESPLIPAAGVQFAEEKYIAPSGLPDDEKQAARQTLQRVVRGVAEESISMQSGEIQEALEPLQVEGPDGEVEWKETVTDAELREIIARFKQIADDAGVPDEPYEIVIPDIIKKIVDEALAK